MKYAKLNSQEACVVKKSVTNGLDFIWKPLFLAVYKLFFL